jgi:hypothetical protein
MIPFLTGPCGKTLTGCCPDLFERSLKGFLPINLIPLKAGLEQALDLSKNVLDSAKICLGNRPLTIDTFFVDMPTIYGYMSTLLEKKGR